MNDDIKNIPCLPELPKELAQVINSDNEKLAIFIGAGVSRLNPINCDGWEALAKKLVKKCWKYNLIKPFDKKYLLQYKDKIRLITLCEDILKSQRGAFMSEMKKSLKDNKVKKLNKDSSELKIYHDLYGLGDTFITTNADRFFDIFFHKDNIRFRSVDFKLNDDKSNKLHKVHGSISDKNSLVFTTKRYIETYTNEEFKNFIEHFFKEYTVLFVGYSLEEIDLLKPIFQTTRKNKRHLYLKPYFKHEKNIVNFEKKYFAELGIKLIPFAKDEKGHEQLKYVIGDWHRQVFIETRKIQNSFVDIDNALENPS